MARSLRGSAAAAGAALLALAEGCGPRLQPNVLIVTFDTTRYDRFGVTGDPEARTPVIDALAARGVLFERSYAHAPITLPSHTTILTGLEPRVHGVHSNGRVRVPDEVDTLAEILSRAGYQTAAMVSAFVLDARYNLDQGFDVYGDDVAPKGDPFSAMVPQRAGDATTDEALAWLAARTGNGPYLLWVHYYDPHQPRSLELPYKDVSDGYRAEIAYADEQLGRLLAGASQADHGRGTLIAFTADHGEGLGQHGEETHAILAYDSTLHVPLIFAGPGVPAGRRSRAFARHVDLVPTILSALALPVPDRLPGRDLLAALSDDAPLDGDFELAGDFECRESEASLGWLPIEGVRTARWKYTARPEPVELYDVIADPGEVRNLALERPEIAARMAALEAARGAGAQPFASGELELDPEEAAKLAALGYVEAPASFAEGERPDPRRFVTSHNWVSVAQTRASNGRYEQAFEILETLAESPSMRPLALRALAPIYERVGRTDDAVAALRRYAELTGSSEARFSIARALVEAGRAEDGLRELDASDLQSPGVAKLRAHALAALGRHAEARAALDREFANAERLHQRARLVVEARVPPDAESELRALLAQAPDDPVLRSSLALRLALSGDAQLRAEALELLGALEREQPESPEVLANIGWSLYRIGRAAQAAAALEAALEAAPARLLDRARLGFVLAELGETERAADELYTALRLQPGAPWAGEVREQLRRLEAKPDVAAPGDASS